MNPDDKRDADRVEILGQLRGEVKVYAPMAIKEISRLGAQIETEFQLQVDSLHDFRLTLGDRAVVVKGRIAHCHISDVEQEVVTYCAGVEFIDVSERIESAIVEFVDAIKGARRG